MNGASDSARPSSPKASITRTTAIKLRKGPCFCPKDQALLAQADSPYGLVQHCSTCHGLWIPAEAIPMVKRRPGIQAPARPISDRVCPNCATRRMEQWQVDKIDIEVCSHCHGVWLDAGELDALVRWHRQTRTDSVALAGCLIATGNLERPHATGDIVEGIFSILDVGEIMVEALPAVLEALGHLLTGLF